LRERKHFSIMPFQTLSTKQSEVAESGIIRLGEDALFSDFQTCHSNEKQFCLEL